jgi:hypothetical protein
MQFSIISKPFNLIMSEKYKLEPAERPFFLSAYANAEPPIIYLVIQPWNQSFQVPLDCRRISASPCRPF